MNSKHISPVLMLILWSSIPLLNSSCANGTKVSWQPFNRNKDQQVAQSTPDQSGSRSGSLFSRKKYHAVDPFLVEQTEKPSADQLATNKPGTSDLPTGKSTIATASNAQPNLPKESDKVVQTTAKQTSAPNASPVIPWEDFNQQQVAAKQPQPAKPQVEEFSIGKLGTARTPAPAAPITQASNAQPFCPPDMHGAQPADCPPNSTSPMTGFENYAPLADINPAPQQLADEYLMDGGDRKQKVYNTLEGVQGLNTEDTVAQYKDHTGKSHTKPSNRVAVYSPKFGAVSSTSDPVVQGNVDKVHATHDKISTNAYDTRTTAITGQQQDVLNANVVRSGPSGLEHLQEFGDVTKMEQTSDHTKLSNPFMERNNTVANQNRLNQAPAVVNTILAAQLWTRVLNPVVVARDQQANEIYSRFREQELVGTEERKSPGNLIITKHADKIQAVQGDQISFRIEFENTGDLPLSDVRIIDNLTPRLQFVPDSATCSMEGKLDIQDNGEGSLILRWELSEPLKGHSKGVVTFKTVVH